MHHYLLTAIVHAFFFLKKKTNNKKNTYFFYDWMFLTALSHDVVIAGESVHSSGVTGTDDRFTWLKWLNLYVWSVHVDSDLYK